MLGLTEGGQAIVTNKKNWSFPLKREVNVGSYWMVEWIIDHKIER